VWALTFISPKRDFARIVVVTPELGGGPELGVARTFPAYRPVAGTATSSVQIHFDFMSLLLCVSDEPVSTAGDAPAEAFSGP
jgi:hypothetical protein